MTAFAPVPAEKVSEAFERYSRVLSSEWPDWKAGKVEKEVPQPNDNAKENRISSEQCKMMGPGEVKKITVDMTTVAEDNAAGLKKVLEEYGVAIITNVVPKHQVAQYEAMWQADLLALAADSESPCHPKCVRQVYKDIEQNGPSHWPACNLFNDKFSEKRGLQHGLYAWSSRLNPNVRQVYSLLEGTDDLVVGTDNVFFNPAHHKQKKEDLFWGHVDFNTNATGSEHKCYQGILYTWGSECPSASTTVVWPKSHKEVFESLMTDPCASESSGQYIPYLKLQDKDFKAKMMGLAKKNFRRVPVPAGSLLLFDSRLSHQGWSNGKRLAATICWQPRSFRSEEARLRKVWMAATGIPSNHWAIMGKVHTRMPDMLTQKTGATTEEETAHKDVELSLYPTIVPYGVKESAIKHWQAALPKLWRGSARHSAQIFKNTSLVEPLLKPEVLAAL